MFSKDCTDDPLFRQLFEAQLALEPSADAYLYGGTLKQKAGDTNGAIADFNKAVELETDPYRKSNILYKIATTVRKRNKSQARNYAQKAINANSSNGKAYLLIANLYATSANACGETPFEKRAIYWRAAEMARKAGRVDPSLSGRASRSAASYSAKAPSKTDIFNSGLAGQTISFKCWVGGSVRVPNL
jgi:tetratricopeptide (TPR) repeat protein